MSVYIENFEKMYSKSGSLSILKKKVLALALQGKLNEGNERKKSSELLELIKSEREAQIENGDAKKNDKIKENDVKELPYEVPKEWTWLSFGDIALFKKGPFGSAITKSMFVPKGQSTYKVYEQKNAIRKDASIGDYYISEEKFDTLKGFEVASDDIIVSCAGTIGETYKLPANIERGIINQALMRVKLSEFVEDEYFLMYFEQVLNSHITINSKGSAMKNIPPLAILKSIPIALPTIDEQKEIVILYNEMKRLIERLEDKLERREQILEQLPAAFIDTITNCHTGDELKEQLGFVLKNFKNIFQTPKSMKELRNIILQLAIEGKLVSKEVTDEPAYELIKRVTDEREKLVKDKVIKKLKKAVPITQNEIPFEIPDNWEWVRAADICHMINYGYTAKSLEHDTGTRMLRITDIQNGEVNWETVPFCSIEDDKISGYVLHENDVVIARTGGTVGKSFIVKNIECQSVYASYLIRLLPSSEVNCDYFYQYLQSPYYWIQLTDGARGGAQPNVNATTLGELIIPLPPFEEQQRIVDKVESIMGIIDKLERQLERKEHITEILGTA